MRQSVLWVPKNQDGYEVGKVFSKANGDVHGMTNITLTPWVFELQTPNGVQ